MADGSATRQPIYNAQPTLRFDGVSDERADGLLLTMSMREAEGGLRSLELEFSNVASTPEGAVEAFGENSVLRLGAQVELYLGEVDRPCEVFRGCITAIESVFAAGAPPRLRVWAEDALLAARLARRSKVYTDMAPLAVVEAVAGELGLTPVVTGLGDVQATWAQIDETDLAFLRRLLARFDADLQIVGRELQVSPRGEVQRNRIALEQGRELHAISICADLAQQVTSVQVRGWDAVAGSAVKAVATGMSSDGPGAGRDGAAMLRDAFGERAENLGHLAVRTDQEAQALAEAAFDRRAWRFVRARGTSEGHPELRVGTRLSLSRCGARFDNDYYVVATHHRWDHANGYRSEFEAECAYLGENA